MMFDPGAFEFASFEVAEGFQGGLVLINDQEAEDGSVGILVRLAPGVSLDLGDGEIGRLRFNVTDEASAGGLLLHDEPISLSITGEDGGALRAVYLPADAALSAEAAYIHWFTEARPDVEVSLSNESDQWGVTADIDADGVSNWSEFLFGLDPNVVDGLDLMPFGRGAGASVRFSRRMIDDRPAIRPQISYDLTEWRHAGLDEYEIESDADGLQTIRVHWDSDAEKGFLRFDVEEISQRPVEATIGR